MIRKGSSRISSLFVINAAWKRMMTCSRPNGVYFGPFEVTSQVFLTTPHSFALVNIKPLLPGHVLICPREPRLRLTDLTAPELTDLFQVVQRVQRMLAHHYFAGTPRRANADAHADGVPAPGTPEAGSFNIAIQDGVEAGQTVPHVHVHIIPRIRGSTAKAAGPGDEIYDSMAAEDGNVGGALWDREVNKLRQQFGDRPRAGGSFPSVEDSERQARTVEEMVAEANLFRSVLEQMGEGIEDGPRQ